jgi:hypothetical protein
MTSLRRRLTEWRWKLWRQWLGLRVGAWNLQQGVSLWWKPATKKGSKRVDAVEDWLSVVGKFLKWMKTLFTDRERVSARSSEVVRRYWEDD